MASIQERRNSAGKITSYRVRWRVNGRMDTVTCETLDQATLWKKLLEANDGDYDKVEGKILQAADTSPSLSDVIEQYIARAEVGDDLTPHTVMKYRQIARVHINPILGEMPVATIDDMDVTRLMLSMRGAGKAPKTVKNMLGVLVPSLDYAVDRGWCPKNVSSGRKVKDRRAGGSPEMVFLTMEEFRDLLGYVDEHFHSFFTLLFTTGLRFSEASALTPEDFIESLDGRLSVRVDKAYKDDGAGGVYLGDPKTPKARRTVPVPPSVVPMLRAHLADIEPGQHVFTMKRGGMILNRRIHDRVWQPALRKAKAAGFPKKPNVHSLRHSFASLMLAGNNISMLSLSATMGHESVLTTTNVYGHLTPSFQYEVSNASATAFPALTA